MSFLTTAYRDSTSVEVEERTDSETYVGLIGLIMIGPYTGGVGVSNTFLLAGREV